MDERLINSLPEMLATAGNVFLLWLCLHGNLRTRGMSYEAWVLYLRLLYIMMAGWENCKQPLKTCYLWSRDNQRERGGRVSAHAHSLVRVRLFCVWMWRMRPSVWGKKIDESAKCVSAGRQETVEKGTQTMETQLKEKLRRKEKRDNKLMP